MNYLLKKVNSDVSGRQTYQEIPNLRPEVEAKNLVEQVVDNYIIKKQIYQKYKQLKCVSMFELLQIIPEYFDIEDNDGNLNNLARIFRRLECNLYKNGITYLETNFSNYDTILSTELNYRFEELITHKFDRVSFLKCIFYLGFDCNGILDEIITNFSKTLLPGQGFKLCIKLAQVIEISKHKPQEYTQNVTTAMDLMTETEIKVVITAFAVKEVPDFDFVINSSPIQYQKRNYSDTGNMLLNSEFNNLLANLLGPINDKTLKGSSETIEQCKELLYFVFINNEYFEKTKHFYLASIFYFASKITKQPNRLEQILQTFNSSQYQFNQQKELSVHYWLEEDQRYSDIFH